jgi:uncharacterized protein (UPF0548 family)
MDAEDFTYSPVGATGRAGAAVPGGYHPMRVRTRVGRGPEVRDAAGAAVLGWRMHGALPGARVVAEGAEAAPGVRVTLELGVGPLRLRAPCRVVWVVREEERVGFGYGTLPGHPASGEEAFVVERLADDSVWLTVTAFSRAATWYTRAGGPFTRAGQRLVGRGYGRALRRCVGARPR